MTGAKDIVQSYENALENQDFDSARKFMQDDMTFVGPLDTFHTADDYIGARRQLAGIIQRVENHRWFVDGDDVCLIYDMITNTPAGTAVVAELYHVTDEKITSLRAIFDARPFAAMTGR
jgi:limonene-1,2-epoxide hydrolase